MNEPADKFGYTLKCQYCSEYFVICSSCFRGQVYCDSTCRNTSRKIKQKLAGIRYRLTDHAKKMQRARQNRYQRKINLTDQSSRKPLYRVIRNPVKSRSHQEAEGGLSVCCTKCNRIVNKVFDSTDRARFKTRFRRGKIDNEWRTINRD